MLNQGSNLSANNSCVGLGSALEGFCYQDDLKICKLIDTK
jgi:hypothetical protein